jgi:hypothetical protein
MTQTAVDWLFKALWEEPKDKLTWYAIFEKAKEMERRQMIDFGDNCVAFFYTEWDSDCGNSCSHEYYNQTYGKDRSED